MAPLIFFGIGEDMESTIIVGVSLESAALRELTLLICVCIKFNEKCCVLGLSCTANAVWVLTVTALDFGC